MCIFVSRPMKIATFLRTNDFLPKRVVDFPRERDTFRNKIMEIVEDFACESKFLHFFFFSSLSHFFVFRFFSIFTLFSIFSSTPPPLIFSFFLLFSFFYHFSSFFFFFIFSFFHFDNFSIFSFQQPHTTTQQQHNNTTTNHQPQQQPQQESVAILAQGVLTQVRPHAKRVFLLEPQRSTCRGMAITEPRGGEGSVVCARGGDTSSRRWLQSWPRTSTSVPHGDRGRPGQGRERETNYTATLRKMLPPRRLVPSTLRWMPGRTHSPWCAADGGTAGGSAYDRVSY